MVGTGARVGAGAGAVVVVGAGAVTVAFPGSYSGKSPVSVCFFHLGFQIEKLDLIQTQLIWLQDLF